MLGLGFIFNSDAMLNIRSTHKTICHAVDGSSNLKLISKLIANPVIMLFLEASLAFQFDLIQNPIADRPFCARVDIGIEPSSLQTFHQVYSGQEAGLQKIEGMAQINAVTAKPPGEAIHPKLMDQWRQARNSNKDNALASSPIGLIEFAIANNEGTITCSVIIRPPAITMAREAGPIPRKSVIRGEYQVPMNAGSLIE